MQSYACRKCGCVVESNDAYCSDCFDKLYPNTYLPLIKLKFKQHREKVPKKKSESWYQWSKRVANTFKLFIIPERKTINTSPCVTKEEYEALYGSDNVDDGLDFGKQK